MGGQNLQQILMWLSAKFHISTNCFRLDEYLNLITLALGTMGRDSVDGIATRYGLDDLGIETQWEARFSAPAQTGPGAHPASYTMG